MADTLATVIGRIIESSADTLVADWLQEMAAGTRRTDLVGDRELRAQCVEFLSLLRGGLDAGTTEPSAPPWRPLAEMLARMAATRAAQGFTPADTATFVFSFKKPLFARLRAELPDAQRLGEAVWGATELLDALGLVTVTSNLRAREDTIRRQQQDMLELSTPVVKLWDGILALPMIGTLDSTRTQVVMETLLQRIVETASSVVIIDITGVPTVDTLVAQHLLKTVAAAKLMGVECIVSGIRPQIAQTIVHLGVDLGGVATRATLRDAIALALKRLGYDIVRVGKQG